MSQGLSSGSIDWDRIKADLRRNADRNTAILSLLLKKAIPKILKKELKLGDGLDLEKAFSDVTQRLIADVAFRAANDLQKLQLYQADRVDPSKVIGYLCFWVRKLRPIQPGFAPGIQERLDLNEMLSLWLMLGLWIEIADLLSGRGPAAKIGPEVIDRMRERFRKLLSNPDGALLKYVVHSMRHRTFGPHHYVMMLKMVIE